MLCSMLVDPNKDTKQTMATVMTRSAANPWQSRYSKVARVRCAVA
jgi:hypothetical protein